ncbi:centromere protein L isoform X2 [Penaeus vannamei]|uniref:centromere protein L isoform X2 n=1 Tax=Penaeus vannamei TaxID=6689 RepID=UPI00387F9A8C
MAPKKKPVPQSSKKKSPSKKPAVGVISPRRSPRSPQIRRKLPKRTHPYPSPKPTVPAKKKSLDVEKTPTTNVQRQSSVGSRQDSSSTPTTPRSAGRYELRNVTPTNYSAVRRRTSMFTPGRATLKTPSRTPFRTPKIKSFGLKHPPDITKASKLHKEDATLWKDQLKLLINRQLNICNLSSVHNFRYNFKNLRKQYEGTLKRMIEDVFASSMLTVNFSTTSFFSLVPNVVDAIYIQVNSLVPGNTVEEDKMMIVYSCWLFKTSHTQSKNIPGVEWFPVMLYTGRNVIHNVVVDWLQGSFDCYVTRRQLRQTDMMWIAGVWSGRKCFTSAHQRGEGSSIDFTYHVRHPDGTSNYPVPNTRSKLKLVMKLNMEDVHHIWDTIVDSSRGEMSVEELQLFFNTIGDCAQQLTFLPAELLQLQQLSTPCLSITSAGKVKLTCVRSASIVVNHLIDIFIQAMNCSALEDHLLADEVAESETSVFLTDDEDKEDK